MELVAYQRSESDGTGSESGSGISESDGTGSESGSGISESDISGFGISGSFVTGVWVG